MFQPVGIKTVLIDIKQIIDTNLMNKSLDMPANLSGGSQDQEDIIIDQIIKKLGTLYGTNNWSLSDMKERTRDQFPIIGLNEQDDKK
jgi:hypothetical protein